MNRHGFTAIHSVSWLLLWTTWLAPARAQVIEPNGLMVPIAPVTSNEVSLQQFFDMRMPPEPIDALRDASAEPATFSPRCGFQAELMLSQSSAPAGLAWYNVPSDPQAVPSEIYQLVPETTQPGAMVSSATIRDDPNYAGGAIGFALTKFGGKPIYYSEATRNAECTACSMPGHWKLMLAYPSPSAATTYYLAWEDWEGANQSGWPDDGDFNDKVFRLSGVRCAGGGEPCDTGLPGACSQGLTGCRVGSEPATCAQLEAASAEVCDGIDNDCDGVIDDDQPCGLGEVCVQGRCTHACGGVEFGCDAGKTCVAGQCVDAACEGIVCEAGKVCSDGRCKAPCEDVQCPLGQLCRSGVCQDPCAAVSCKAGSVCRDGACLESCTCSGCPEGLACDAANGRCVAPGCEGKTCPAGQACAAGSCVDACQGARCPNGASCSAGQCEGGRTRTPVQSAGAPALVQAGQTGSTPPLITGAGSGAGAAAPQAQGGARPRAASEHIRAQNDGCGCQVLGAGRASSAGIAWLAAASWLALFGRRRRSRARR